MINKYNDQIRKDIALEFGLEAGGYSPRSFILPSRIAQRIASKYPSNMEQGRYGTITLNPKAVTIANRYLSLVMGVK